MKKYNLLKVVLIAILVVAVCTWIFPIVQFDGTSDLVESERNQVGIYDLFAYFVVVLRNFPYVLVMALSIGAFYGVAYKIPAYRELLDDIVAKFKGKEHIFLIAVMTIIAAIVSVTGISFAILFVYPFVISIVLLMGYNKLVAASTTVGATVVGIIGTTLGANTNYYINYVLDTKVTNEMVTKVILLVLGLVLLIYNVISYAKKTKNNTDEVLEGVPSRISNGAKEIKVAVEEVKETKKEEKEVKKTKSSKKTTTKKKAPAKKSGKTRANDLTTSDVKVVKNGSKKTLKWPFILVFDLVFVILAVSTFDWEGVAKTNWAIDSLNSVREFTIGGFPIFDKLLGGVVTPFGQWSLMYEMPITIILAAGFLAFIYGVKFDKFLDGFIEGMKKAFKPGMIMLLPYIIFIICANSPFELHITKFLLGLSKGLNVITMSLTAMVSSMLNIEPTYIAQYTLPYVNYTISDTTVNPIISIIFQSIYGLVSLIAPTSIILIGTLSYLEIPYTQWIKHIWKLFLELLVVLMITFLILVLI